MVPSILTAEKTGMSDNLLFCSV